MKIYTRKITGEILKEIARLATIKKVKKKDIPALIKKKFDIDITLRSVYSVLKDLRVPEYEEKKTEFKINELLSIHLLYNCNDLKLLTQMFVTEIYYQKPEKIIVPDRILKIVPEEKIKKIVNIACYAGVECDISYGAKVFA